MSVRPTGVIPVTHATTFALGVNYELTPKTNLLVDYNYYDRIFADFDPSDRGEPGPDAWEMPSYGLFDLALRHKFNFGKFEAQSSGRINNVFNTEYISDAQDGSNSDAQTQFVSVLA